MSFIIYEDDALVVLDKPAGCSSEEGVPQRLREQWGKPDAYVGVIHRLDTGVSGLMVYAKTPQAAAALRCPVCGGALMPLGTSLRCPQGHSYDMAKEGYVNLLAIQKRHAADPGDGKAMVRARRAFLQAGYYAPFQKALAELCLEYAPECGETHLLDAGCGEGSYDRVVYDAFAAQGRPCVLAGFDLSKDAIRLAAKLLPEAAFAVGGSFSAPVRVWVPFRLPVPFWGGVASMAASTARIVAPFAVLYRISGRLAWAFFSCWIRC